MTIIAVLDADVLDPMVLRDTLLRAAAAGRFRLHWSARILDEAIRNLAAAAVVAEATMIVTSNLRHFRALPKGVAAVSPDMFLQHLADTQPGRLSQALEAQVRAYRRPPVSMAELLKRLAIVAPGFAARMAARPPE